MSEKWEKMEQNKEKTTLEVAIKLKTQRQFYESNSISVEYLERRKNR